MTKSLRVVSTLAAAVAALFVAQLPARAADADAQEVMAYTLTEAGLAKYTKATNSLAALPGGVPGSCSDDDDSDSEANSISDLVAKIDAAPGAKAAIQSAGLSSREYIVFSLSLLQNGLAAWGMKQAGAKLPPGVKQANVDFVNSHGPQLEQLKGADKGCGGDEADEEEPDE